MVSVDSGSIFDFGFGVIVGDSIGSSFMGVDGRVFMNFRSYGDLVCSGLVGSVRNMRRRRSSVQYRSSGVDRRGSSSSFISAAGSSRTAC